MVLRWCSIRRRWLRPAIGSNRATTFYRNKTSKNRRRPVRLPIRKEPEMRATSTLLFLCFVSLAVAAAPVKKEPSLPGDKARQLSLVRVNVTGQQYDYFRPWQKKAPFSKRGLGAVLPQNR